MPIYKIDKKRNGLQGYRVKINYTDMNGVARQVERTVYGKAEADLTEQRLLAEYKETKQIVKSKKTIRELYDEYEQYHKTETRITSHDSVVRTLHQRVLPTMSGYRLDKLTQPVLASWKIEIDNQDISLRTKQNAYKAFSALLNYAVKMEYIPKNPLSALGNFKDSTVIDKPADKLHYYTPEQFYVFIQEAKKHTGTVIDWGYYVFFNIAFYTGARKGEINALKWSDIEGNIMHIRRSISQKVKGADVETPPKNKSSYRDLQLPKPLIKILNEHRERQKAVAGELFSDDYRICGGVKPLRDTTIEKKNTAYSKAAKLPHIRIHDYRHSHASVLVNEGINIQEIARRLGHSDVRMTWNTYSHLYPREEERAVEILNRILPE